VLAERPSPLSHDATAKPLSRENHRTIKKPEPEDFRNCPATTAGNPPIPNGLLSKILLKGTPKNPLVQAFSSME